MTIQRVCGSAEVRKCTSGRSMSMSMQVDIFRPCLQILRTG